MKIERTTTIESTPARAWAVLGDGFAEAYRWASSVYHSRGVRGPNALAGCDWQGRTCETSIGAVSETVVEFDEQAHRIAYVAQAADMPKFVRQLRAQWTLQELPSGETQVTMRLDVDIAFPFNWLMGPMMRIQLAGIVKNTLAELKHYLEVGEPHPRKVEAAAKFAAKAA